MALNPMTTGNRGDVRAERAQNGGTDLGLHIFEVSGYVLLIKECPRYLNPH